MVYPVTEVSSIVKGHHRSSTHETITGSFSGTAHVVPISSTSGTSSFLATGSGTVLGTVSVTGSDRYAVTAKHKIKYTSGTLTITDASGDTITASFKGSGKVLATGTDSFKVTGSVTGGTGLYTGAAGKISSSGTLDTVTDAFTMTGTIKLKHA